MPKSLVTKILFVSADPTDEARLRLGEEIREVRERIQLSQLRDRFELTERHCVRPVDLTQAIFDTDPDIVHFSGHGSSEGSLLLEDRNGEAHPISPDALEAVFELFSNKIFCVVLNACYSAQQAEAIAHKIQYVVGMRDSIGDAAAITFSVGFYKAVLNQRSIADAFQFGLAEMRLSGLDEHTKPILLTNSKTQKRLIVTSGVARQHENRAYWTSPSMPGRSCITIREGYQEPGVYALVDPTAYANLGNLLDELFMEALSDTFPPYTYGNNWILVDERSSRAMVVAPLIWAASDRQPVFKIAPGWQKSMAAVEKIPVGSHWSVHELRPEERYYGVATNNPELLDYLLRNPKAIWRLRHELDSVPISDYNESRHPYNRIFRNWLEIPLEPGHILVDPGIRFSLYDE